jgi:flagellar basal-body rod protein FlgG
MDASMWIAKTGLDAQQTRMSVISNNLANVNTTGFKRDRASFEDMLYQNLRQPGSQAGAETQVPTGLMLGTGVRIVSTEKTHTQGSMVSTKNALDMAVQGSGFFQITQSDGTTAYTRDGTFIRSATGQLVTAGGYPLLDGITVPQDATKLSISKSGIVSVTVPGNAQPQQIGQLNTASFINPAGLEPIGENLYRESAASGAPQAGTPGTNNLGTVMQGFLESSNVNVVEELVQMIQTQRAYEMNSKAISTSDQMLAKLSQL